MSAQGARLFERGKKRAAAAEAQAGEAELKRHLEDKDAHALDRALLAHLAQSKSGRSPWPELRQSVMACGSNLMWRSAWTTGWCCGPTCSARFQRVAAPSSSRMVPTPRASPSKTDIRTPGISW